MPDLLSNQGGGIGGSGTTNTIPKFTAVSVLGNSSIVDDGTSVQSLERARFGTQSSTEPVLLGGATYSILAAQSNGTYGLVVGRATADVSAAHLAFYKTRSGTNLSTLTALASGDINGDLTWQAPSDGSTVNETARIEAKINGTVSSNVIPTDLVFYTTATSAPVEHFRIASNGTSSFFSGQTAVVSTATAVSAGSGKIGVQSITTGTYDTTAGTATAIGVQGQALGTRSAGGNNLTNIGGEFTATGAQSNISMRTLSGDVLLNVTSGATAIGTGINVNRQLLVLMNSSASTVTDRRAINGQSSGTYDTTAGNATSYGVLGSADSTRSAGANTLTNIGGFFTATSGTVNRALQTNDGDVLFNQVSGTTGIAVAASTTRQLNVQRSSTASTAGSTTTYSFNTGTYDTTAGALTATAVIGVVDSTRSAGANSLTNIGANFSASGAQVNTALQTDNGNVILNASSGNTTIGAGATTTSALNFNGRESIWVSNPSAVTASTVMLNMARGGTFDTTAGALTSTGLTVGLTSSRSAGANNLVNRGILVDVTGGQTNTAILADRGDVVLNNTSGNTMIGTATAAAKVTIERTNGGNVTSTTFIGSGMTAACTTVNSQTTGTFDTTAGALEATGVNGNAVSTRSAGANNLTNTAGRFNATGAQVNRAILADNGDVYLNASSGLTGIGVSPVAAQQLTVQSASNSVVFKTTGADSNSLIKLQNDAQNWQIGVRGSGASDELIIRDESASVDVLTITKSTGAALFSGNLSANGNVAIGNASGDAHTLLGTLNANATAGSNGEVLSIVSGVPKWTTLSGISGVTGLGMAGYMAVWNTTTDLTTSAALHEASGAIVIDGGSASVIFTAGGSTWTGATAIRGLTQPTAATAQKIGVLGDAQGTYNTTAVPINTFGVQGSATSTRSAGANDLNNIGVYASASGAQGNVALLTNTGLVMLVGSGTSSDLVRVNGAGLRVGDSAYAGSYVSGFGATAASVLTVSNTSGPVVGDRTNVTSTSGGTFDATAAVRTNIAVDITASATRSAGANALTNYGLRATASGAQTNIALQTESGDVVLNNTAGTTTIKGATTLNTTLAVNGNATLGDASGDAHTLNGNITLQNAPTAGHIKVGAVQARILLAVQRITGTGTYTPTTGTKAVRVRMVGGGGGGGGAVSGNTGMSLGGGGWSGTYFEKWIDPGATITGGAVTIGAAGTGGVSGGNAGGPGGDTSVTVQGTLYTAKGGAGGSFSAFSNGSTASGYVAYVTGSSVGDFNVAGQGGLGFSIGTGSIAEAGLGGSSPLGAGGSTAAVGVGQVGTGFGSGGSGGKNYQTIGTFTGGAGTIGLVIIEEFA